MAKKPTEAERLRHEAERLLKQQREILNHAGEVVRGASAQTRHKIVEDVLPSIAGVLGTTLSAVESARGLRAKASKLGFGSTKASPAPAPRKSGAGKYVALGFGLAVLVGVGYVLWENFRADDELWIDDEA